MTETCEGRSAIFGKLSVRATISRMRKGLVMRKHIGIGMMAIVLSCLPFGPAAQASPMTWKEMTFVCQIYGVDFCNGYIVGTFQTLQLVKQICPVRYPKIEEMRAMTDRYFSSRTDEKLDGGLAAFVREAAIATYPCAIGK